MNAKELSDDRLNEAIAIVHNDLPPNQDVEICISKSRPPTIYWQNLRIQFTSQNYSARIALIKELILAEAYFD